MYRYKIIPVRELKFKVCIIISESSSKMYTVYASTYTYVDMYTFDMKRMRNGQWTYQVSSL